jgi:RNA polymerase sigma-70 factor (ECF subfamily)
VNGEPDFDDLAAIHRVLAGDQAAFRSIVERYGERVRRFCRARLGSQEEAEDTAQDIFLRVYRSLRTFRLGQSFPVWLFSIAANRTRTRLLRFATEKARISAAERDAEAAVAEDPADEALRHLEAAALRKAVASLPLEQRGPVELYYFAELSIAETAHVLSLGEEAVKSRLFRARKQLRELLENPQPQTDPGGNQY